MVYPDLLAIQIAHLFQIYLGFLLIFSATFLIAQSQIPTPLFSKGFSLVLVLGTFSSGKFGGGVLTYYLNPAYGLTFLLVGLLALSFSKLSRHSDIPIPYWFQELIRKSNIMICICLIVMLGYWLNPYSEPLSYLIK
ncbi:MAG: hypothetical protein Ct9H300mP20_21030 [Gammaproteobacteria bacterium]|nr:MAG: hypothetical protein Ct9H300mP20_21030 [Gammaproteobacteria bacterium]